MKAVILVVMFTMSSALVLSAQRGDFYEIGEEKYFPETDRFLLTPFAGVLFYSSLKPLPNTGVFEDLQRPSSFLVGVRASRFLTRSFAVEFSLSRSSTENVHKLLYYDPEQLEGNPVFGSQTLRNSINPISRLGANILYLPPVRGPIVPHISAGFGWIHHSPRKQVAVSIAFPDTSQVPYPVLADTIDVPPLNVKTRDQGWLTIDFGGGLTGRVNQSLAVRVDAILHLSKFSPLDVEGPLTGDVFYASPQWVNDVELSTGLIFTVPAPGLRVGPKAGWNLTSLRGNDVRSSDSNAAYYWGAFADYAVNDFLSIQPEFLFSEKSAVAREQRVIFFGLSKEMTSLKFDSRLKYFEIPVMAKLTFPVHDMIKPDLFFGPSVAMKVGGNYKVTYETESEVFETQFHKSADFGLVFGGGADFTLGTGRISLDIRYYRGLTTIDDSPGELEGPFDIKTRVVSLMLGYSLVL